MKSLIILAAASALALTASAASADPGGHGHGHGDKSWGQGRDRDDGDRDWRSGDRQNYGYHHSSYRNCPPGLAKRRNGCMAPGQYRHQQQWARGQRLPYGYNDYTAYNQIPYSYRNRYNLDPNNRYIYRDNTIYQVDPRTQIIQQILGGLIR